MKMARRVKVMLSPISEDARKLAVYEAKETKGLLKKQRRKLNK